MPALSNMLVPGDLFLMYKVAMRKLDARMFKVHQNYLLMEESQPGKGNEILG